LRFSSDINNLTLRQKNVSELKTGGSYTVAFKRNALCHFDITKSNMDCRLMEEKSFDINCFFLSFGFISFHSFDFFKA
jgi:hypothetical protein